MRIVDDLGAYITRDGDRGRVRQDELDLVKTLSPPPVLHGGCPAVTGITQTVSEDDGGCVALYSGKYEGLGVSESHADSVCSADPSEACGFAACGLRRAISLSLVLLWGQTER